MLAHFTRLRNSKSLADLSKKVLLLSTGSTNDGVSAPGKATSSSSSTISTISTISSDSIVHRLSRPTTFLSREKYVGGSYSHRGLSFRPFSSIEYQYDYDDDDDDDDDDVDEEVEAFLRGFKQDLMNLAKQAYVNVGPNKKEKPYHDELHRLLEARGYDVRWNDSLTYRDQGSTKAKRVDLTVSIPGKPKDILIECKALKKIEKEGIKQVLDYQELSGSSVCYLVNFYRDPKNDFEEVGFDVKGRFWDDTDSLYNPRINALSIFPEAASKGN
jgi:GxxExxY protein